MKKSSRFTSLAILTAMLISAVSCGETASGSVDTTVSGDTTSPTEVTTDLFSGINVKDYGGRKFNFLVRTSQAANFYTETATGDVFSDSVYKAVTAVEDRFNIEYNPILVDGEWADRSNYIGIMRSSVMAGDGAYDLIDGYAAVIGDAYNDKIFVNLLEVPELRLDEAWWSAKVKNALTVNDRLYAMTGDLAVNMWGNLQVSFFNKDLMDEYKITYPYQLVKDGKWTLSALLSTVKDVSKDLNGNGEMDEQDRFGIIIRDDLAVDNLRVAFGGSVMKLDSKGIPVLDPANERMVTIYEKIEDMLYNNPDVNSYGMYGSMKITSVMNCFTDGLIMYFFRTLEQSILMRDTAVNFGILPPPKFDESQEDYYTTSRDGRSMFVIPIDTDTSFAGTITEALCVAFSEYVIPAYYDKVLKYKMLRDDESGEMLDIIRDSFTLDFAGEYAIQAGDAGQIVRKATHTTQGIMSYYESNRSAWEGSFASFIKAYLE